jgi:hypothetical protein
MTIKLTHPILTFLLITLIHCGSAGTRVGNPPTNTTNAAFPTNLAITSPLEASATADGNLTVNLQTQTAQYSTKTKDLSEEIAAIYDSSDTSECIVDLTDLNTNESDADCYGPSVDYQFHPNDPSNSDIDTLPPGDVGMWSEIDSTTENACAAAQLNQRLSATQLKATTALKTLASLKCIAAANGIDLPSDGTTLNLAPMMNTAYEAADNETTFTSASLSLNSSVYSYQIDFTTTPRDSSDNIEGTLSLSHQATTDGYEGILKYTLNTDDFGDCTASTAINAASALYNFADDNLVFKMNYANYCNSSTDPFINSGLLDATDIFDATSNPDGWTQDFTEFVADFDVTTNVGSFTYAWQAGSGDAYSRAFNIELALGDDDLLTGDAFFGFGEAVDSDDFDGSILGFICNWAGPSSDLTSAEDLLVDFLQHQSLTQDSTGLFSATSSIEYAPTDTCSYGANSEDPLGSFTYDSNGDGTIDTDPDTVIENGLAPITDYDFTLPSLPENNFL